MGIASLFVITVLVIFRGDIYNVLCKSRYKVGDVYQIEAGNKFIKTIPLINPLRNRGDKIFSLFLKHINKKRVPFECFFNEKFGQLKEDLFIEEIEEVNSLHKYELFKFREMNQK